MMKQMMILGAMVVCTMARAQDRSYVDGKPMMCGNEYVKFDARTDRVRLGQHTFHVEWTDGSSDGLFDGRHFNAAAMTLDDVPCAFIDTAW